MSGSDREILIEDRRARLPGVLTEVSRARGIVIFAHGSGSTHLSPRNRAVARVLNAAGFSTLLFDLLTEEEASDRRNVFDIAFLADRLAAATRWIRAELGSGAPPIGYFGASTGGAAAIVAAARDDTIASVVSRGGRPDLAGESLKKVRAPVLLIVGGDDEPVTSLNRQAEKQIWNSKLVVIPGAGHLFEGPGELEIVADIAAEWFKSSVGPKKNSRPVTTPSL